VLADMERDFWMNAAEAVDYGIVSRIIESSSELT
jgi:ATP-dependent Clp protease protease subunit